MFSSCSRLGWGILLWSSEDPPIPSGTILPVYIQSNIDQVWVVGIPENYRNGKKSIDKMEIPLAQFELAGGKGKARKRAEEFSRFARTYAETLQDGLPIRENSDNGARRVYRLRIGEIIKVLAQAEGSPPISTSGDPLPGEWYEVLTEDGSTGYCFSYRLKLFEHYGGPLAAAQTEQEEIVDPDLENLLAKTWSPESYGAMLNNRRINLEDLSRHWRFDPGQETGIARIYTPPVDLTFSYTAIRPAGARTWRFEGSPLRMSLRSDTSLAVLYTESGGAQRTLLFTALPIAVDDLIIQESARRENLFLNIYGQGPAFTSNNYGTISFTETGEFYWTSFTLLVPQVIPRDLPGSGTIDMDLFLSSSLQDRYNGAFTLRFNRPDTPAIVRFMYTLDSQGFRLEYVPETGVEGLVVSRRAPSPMVLYFFKAEGPAVFPQAGR
ncbi:MAG: SH3 domain-containing protein [Treponema sp.]|nr:SH3 domain-containing protein [Treponema sp.]